MIDIHALREGASEGYNASVWQDDILKLGIRTNGKPTKQFVQEYFGLETPDQDELDSFVKGFILGFFSSYESDDIPKDARKLYDQAYFSEAGEVLLELYDTKTF